MSAHSIPRADDWEPWSPQQTAERLAGCRVDWAVAGGWALDLWRVAVSRPHKDIEIVVRKGALPVLRAHLRHHQFFAAASGRLTPMAEDAPEASRQHWVLDPGASKWRLDVMIEPGDEQRWICRRDQRITAPRTDVIAVTDSNIPYLRPHVVLLFKAQQLRPVDEWDFSASVELLDGAERQWLREALRLTAPEPPLDGTAHIAVSPRPLSTRCGQ